MARAAGLAKFLRDELDAEVEIAAIPYGKRLYVTKGDCTAKVDVHRDHVNWVDIQAPKGSGWLKEAHRVARSFPQFGISYLLAWNPDGRVRGLLKRYGDWREVEVDGRPRLRWDL